MVNTSFGSGREMRKRKGSAAVPEGGELKARLSAYSAVTHSPHRRSGNWAIYAAATGSALAMATGASASIISAGTFAGATVEPQGPNHLNHTTGNYTNHSSIKGLFFGLGGDELNIRAKSGMVTSLGTFALLKPFAQLSVQGVSPVGIFVTGGSLARNFAPGEKISNAPGHTAQNAAALNGFFTGADFGNFAPGVPGYVGMAFKTAGGHFDYGWLKLVFTSDPITKMPEILTALSYGLNTSADEGINAGQTPEPGTLALALLASGATGVMALRRRRRPA
jgi:hypothetical protein